MATVGRFFSLPQQSCFLLGPRGTGKTTFLGTAAPQALVVNLQQPEVHREMLARPARIRELVLGMPADSTVVVDEVQRVPELLTVVHDLMQKGGGYRFVLTGSSARKLRRGATDLLAGRALMKTMHPFMGAELPDFDLDLVLAQGLLPVVRFANNPREALRYDAAGRFQYDSILNFDSISANRYVRGQLRSTQHSYDARGLRTRSANRAWNLDTLANLYNGIGHLVIDTSISRAASITTSLRSVTVDQYLSDAMANQSLNINAWSTQANPKQGAPQPFEVGFGRNEQKMQPGTGRLGRLIRFPTLTSGAFLQDSLAYDAAGNVEFQYTQVVQGLGAADITRNDRASYFDALNRLRATDSRTAQPVGVEWQVAWTFEDYRLDALGRRVLYRSQRLCSISWTGFAPCAVSLIRRTVWDGSMPLLEVQQPGYVTSSGPQLENDIGFPGLFALYDPNGTRVDPNQYFGRVLYVNGPALDQPLAVVRFNLQTDSLGGTQYPTPFTLVPHWNAQGEPDMGAFSDGTGRLCPVGKPCIQIGWPFGWTPFQKKTWQQLAWHGSLIEQQRDGSGLLYKRNRYLDPATARFNQEDPIGLAGGLSTYGYAGGDPVNFSDPFGLKVTPVGAEAARIIAELRRSSPTFRRVYDALDAADASKVNIAFRLGSRELVGAISRGASYQGVFDRPNERRPGAQIVVTGADPEVIGHEFAHAAGSFARVVYKQSGVPGVCANDQQFSMDSRCAGVQLQVRDEAKGKAKSP